jgi:hypothetical protein
MSKNYEKSCIFCGKKIKMSDELGKWRPFNENGSEHNCQKKQEDQRKVNGAINEIQKEKQRTALTVDEIVKRLKSVGINIDLDTFLRSTDPK